MKKILIIVFVILLGVLGTYLLSKHCCAPKVEQEIKADAEKILASSADYEGYTVDVDGWNLTVSGQERDSLTTSNLMLALGGIPVVNSVESAFGETAVDTEIEMVEEVAAVVDPAPLMFNLNKAAGELSLSEIPAGFETEVDGLSLAAADFEKLDLSIEGNKVKVVGDLSNGISIDSMKQKILGLLPDFDIDFDLSQSGLDELLRICQSELNQFLESTTIQFDTNSDALSASSAEALNTVVELLIQCSKAHVDIEGHSDSTGTEDWNLTLSQLRAESIKNYLVAQGVPAEQLTATGAGSSKPIATNATKAGRQLNRRIEMIVKATN